MLCKLVFVVSLAVGVLGRTVFNRATSYSPYPSRVYDPYDEYSQQVATEYCKATNAEDKIPQVQASIKTFANCLMNVFNVEDISTDFTQAKAIGAYDDLIKKYCAKSPEVKDCTRDLINGMSPCLPPGDARRSEKTFFAMIDFLCDNDGARITSFLNEDGLKCIDEQQIELAICQGEMKFNITKAGNQYGEGAAGMLKISEKEKCGLIDNGLSCYTKALKGCSNRTPGNLAQEFQNVYLNNHECSEDTYETQTVAVTEKVIVPQALVLSSGIVKDIDFLMKRKLELEVRTAELEIWKQENELNVKHTGLTSDVQTI